MAKRKNPWLPYIGILLILGLWFVYSQWQEKQYDVPIQPLFDIENDRVSAFVITKDSNSVALIRQDSVWAFGAPDTGAPAPYKIDQFLKDVLGGEREGSVTDDSSRYRQFGVGADGALALELKDGSETIMKAFIGRSSKDLNQEFIRYEGNPRVYLSRQKIINKLGTTASWWR